MFIYFSKMFAGVKFACDNAVSIVSIDFIKNFKLPVEFTKTYKVFWSNNPDDLPDENSKNMDKVYKNRHHNNKEKIISIPSGYFNAKILCTADTFEDTKLSLENLGHEMKKQSKDRMSKAGMAKIINSAAAYTIRGGLEESSQLFSDSSDENDTLEPVKSYKIEIRLLKDENSKLELGIDSLQKEFISIKEQLSISAEEKIILSEKLHKIKGKYKDLKEELKTTRNLNYDLQHKVISSLFLTSSPFNSNSEPCSPSLLSPIRNRNNTINTSSLQSSKAEETTDLILPTGMEPETQPNEDHETSLKDHNFILSDSAIKNSSIGCKHGKCGDKVYVKNLAENLFGRSVLINSSVTGRKPPTGGKPARPGLPKAGIMYLQELLQQRVFNEISGKASVELTEDEKILLNERSSSSVVIGAVGDKIATLRRLGNK